MAKTGKNNKRNSRYIVALSQEQVSYLKELLADKKLSLTLRKRAQILLAVNTNANNHLTHVQISESLDVSTATITHAINNFTQNGLESCMTLKRNPNSNNIRKITGEQEARLIQLACSEVPQGHAHWSLELLRNKAIELKIIEPVAIETLRTTLKKMNFSLIETSTGASHQKPMQNL